MKKIYLMGIGGAGMNALAGLFKERGDDVRGADGPIYPPASDELARLGVEIREGYRPENLAPRPDLVVVGNVISKSNPEYAALTATDIPYTSMAQAIAEYFIEDRESIVIAGTHGKSTTTSLTAFLLDACGEKPGYFVGGIPLNFQRAYRASGGKYFVIEGDEYDTACFEKTPKFFHYRPRHVVLTSVEFDHADIYRDLDHVKEQFDRLVDLVPPSGKILACGDEANVRAVCKKRADVAYYGLGEGCDWRAVGVEDLPRGKRFEIRHRDRSHGFFETTMIGEHNVKNALGSLALLLTLGVDAEKLRAALPRFAGVRRRQEFLSGAGGALFFDDFAHHPTAIRETLAAFLPVKKHSGGRLWALFEPRSNTVRRRVFEKVLPQSFAEADEIILSPVYQKKDALAADELLQPDEVVASLQAMGKRARSPATMEEIEETLVREVRPGDVVVFMTNGTFGGIARRVVDRIAARA